MYGGVTAVDGTVAYFRPIGYSDQILYAYNSTNHKWSELPMCPNCAFSLAVVNRLLTAIGGKTPDGKVTNSLLSFTGGKWAEKFPPMPTNRWLNAAVCSNKSLVVAGGVGERDEYLSSVEVMDTETLQWSIAISLPGPLIEASATLCGGQVYILGGLNLNDEQSQQVFSCSLAGLLRSCRPPYLGAEMNTWSQDSDSEVWRQRRDTPHFLSACASLQGRLLAVGGQNSDEKKKATIYIYNTTAKCWKTIGRMTTPRSQCLVAVLPHNEFMVVGGYTPDGITDSVEIATIV